MQHALYFSSVLFLNSKKKKKIEPVSLSLNKISIKHGQTVVNALWNSMDLFLSHSGSFFCKSSFKFYIHLGQYKVTEFIFDWSSITMRECRSQSEIAIY